MDGRPTPKDPDKLLRRSRSAAIAATVAGGIATAGLITGVSHATASRSSTTATSTSGSSMTSSTTTRTHRSSSSSNSSSEDSTGTSSTGGIGAATSMRQAQGGSNGS